MAKYTKEQARAILEGCFPDEGDFDFFIFQSMPAIFRRFKQFNIAGRQARLDYLVNYGQPDKLIGYALKIRPVTGKRLLAQHS